MIFVRPCSPIDDGNLMVTRDIGGTVQIVYRYRPGRWEICYLYTDYTFRRNAPWRRLLIANKLLKIAKNCYRHVDIC
jgi:hypothetical protein